MTKRSVVLFLCSVLFLLWLTPIERTDAISDGVPATENYPWVVALTISDDPNTPENEELQAYFCGGVLIHPEYVLTAQHCVESLPSGVSYLALIGANDRANFSGERIALSGSPILYGQDSNLDDIALWKLSSASGANVIGIPTSSIVYSLNSQGSPFTTMGWGQYDFNSPLSETLNQAHFSQLDWADRFASVSTTNQGTCIGDSGNPLVVKDYNGKWVLAGLNARFTSGTCGYYSENTKALFTNVPYYHTWIYSIIAPGCGQPNGADVYLHTGSACSGQSIRARTSSLSEIWFDPISVYVPAGKSIFLTDGAGNHLCTDHSMWNLSQDYLIPSNTAVFQNLKKWIVYDDTTCGGTDSNGDGNVEFFSEPQSAIVDLDGDASNGSTVTGSLDIFQQTNYNGGNLGDYSIGTHAFSPDTLMYSFRLKNGAGSFVVKNDTGNQQCFSSDVPNMQDYSNYWHKTVQIDVYSHNACGSINGQLKIYNQTNYTGNLLGTYIANNTYTFPVSTQMYSFDLDGAGSFVVTAQNGERQCFNSDVPNMQDYSEYWHQTVQLEVLTNDLCIPSGSPAPAVGSGNGLWRNQFRILWDEVDIPDLSIIAPISWGPINTVTLNGASRQDELGMRFDGCISLPVTDTYTFYLMSNDGSRLYIDNQLVVDNDGQHSGVEVSGSVTKQSGKYQFRVDYFQDDEGRDLFVSVATPTMPKRAVPDSWYSYGTACTGTQIGESLVTSNWSYSQTLVINAEYVQDDLTDFPVLLANGVFTHTVYSNTLSSGADLRFTADSAGTNELPFEIVSWNPASRTSEVWVLMPEVSNSLDTPLYVWYGNALASAYAPGQTYGSQNVWNDYGLVMHMDQPGMARFDSTSNYNNARSGLNIAQGQGKIGVGTDFEASDAQYLTVVANNTLDLPTFTIQAWTKQESFTSQYPGIVTNRSNTDPNGNYAVFLHGDLGYRPHAQSWTDSTWIVATWGSPSTLQNWDMINTTYSGGLYSISVNGGNLVSNSVATSPQLNDNTIQIGKYMNSYFDGIIDELRMSSLVRTNGWLQTEHNNQNNPELFFSGTPAVSPSTTWIYSQTLTIDHNQVMGDLVDFPVLVSDGIFADHFYTNANTGCSDLLFSSDTQLQNELPFEIVSCDTALKTAEVWVKLPNVSSTTNTTFYAWYGNDSASAYVTTDTFGSQQVWNDYALVMHLNETSGTRYDATSNYNNASPNSAISYGTGKIGSGVDLEFSNSQYLSIASNSSLDLPTFTIQAWAFNESFADSFPTIITNRSGSSTNGNYLLMFHGGINYAPHSQYWTGSSWSSANQGSGSAIGTWYMLNAVYDGANHKMSVNGNAFTSNPKPSPVLNDNPVYIGRWDTSYFDGIIDELRITTVARSIAWIQTEYNNQNNPASFFVTP